MSSLLVWGLAAAAAVAWGLKLSSQAMPVPAHATIARQDVVAGGDLSRLLGQPPAAAEAVVADAAPPADGRFKLLGVVAPRPGQRFGLALISVDGQPARVARVGAEVAPGVTLVSVGHLRAELGGSGGPAIVLELPRLAEAQRGRPGEVPVAGNSPQLSAVAQPGLPPVMGVPGAGLPPGAVPVQGAAGDGLVPQPGAVSNVESAPQPVVGN